METKFSALALARFAVLGATALSGTAVFAQEKVVLGYIPASLEYPYNVATAEGFEEEARKLGAEPAIIDPRGSVERQSNAVTDLVAQGAKGVAILPLDGIVAQSWVDELTAEGLPVVSVGTLVGDANSRAWSDVYPNLTALVGMDNVLAGRRAGEIAVTLLPKDREVSIAIIEGAAGYPQVGERSRGFLKALDDAQVQYKIVSSQPTNWTAEDGEAVCQNVLISHPNVDLIFSQADDMAIGCALALDSSNSEAKLVATGGGSKLGIAAIAAGDLDGSVCDNPAEAGRMAARALYEAATAGAPQKGQLMNVETPAITAANLQDCPNQW